MSIAPFWLESEPLLLAIDVELDFPHSRNNICFSHTQKRPPLDQWSLCIDLHVKNDKVHRHEEVSDSHQDILSSSHGVADRLQTHSNREQGSMVKLVKYYQGRRERGQSVEIQSSMMWWDTLDLSSSSSGEC